MVYKRNLFHSAPPVMNRALSPRDEIYNRKRGVYNNKRIAKNRENIYGRIYLGFIQIYILIALLVSILFHIYSIYVYCCRDNIYINHILKGSWAGGVNYIPVTSSLNGPHI